MTEQQWLEECCCHWQRVLGLQDWDIEIGWKTMAEIGDCLFGESHIHLDKRWAQITILSQDDSHWSHYERSVEDTVIHELLHCVLAPFTHVFSTGCPEYITEQIIEQLGKAVGTDHGRVEP